MILKNHLIKLDSSFALTTGILNAITPIFTNFTSTSTLKNTYKRIDILSIYSERVEVAGWQPIEGLDSEKSIYYLMFVGIN